MTAFFRWSNLFFREICLNSSCFFQKTANGIHQFSVSFVCKLWPLLSKVSGALLHAILSVKRNNESLALTQTPKGPELTEVKVKSSILLKTEKISFFQYFFHLFTHKKVPCRVSCSRILLPPLLIEDWVKAPTMVGGKENCFRTQTSKTAI